MPNTKIPSVSELREVIIDLLKNEGLKDSAYQEILNYSLEKFDKQHLDDQYYGYHNASHELVVTYNTLLASRGEEFTNTIHQDEFKHLYAAALFHDYEPNKQQDRPHEVLAANFVASDHHLLKLFKECGIDPNLVAVLILRTMYPWYLHSKEIRPHITEFFKKSKLSEDKKNQDHYLEMGWFLSVADRIGAYALGDFLDAMALAKKNSHSMGWDPEFLVRRSIVYFETLLNEEHEMTDKVMRSLPKSMRETFMDNVLGFFKLREKELQVRADIVYDKIQLIPHLENLDKLDSELEKKLFDIFQEMPEPLQFKKKKFFESLKDPKTILVTLRLGSEDGIVIGFAKGGPLESYTLASNIKDENRGKSNTVFLEPLAIKMGYWGQCGGPNMRKLFNSVAKEKGYLFLTSLQLREVIQNRIDRNEQIEFVQQLNPERLDYYRVTL